MNLAFKITVVFLLTLSNLMGQENRFKTIDTVCMKIPETITSGCAGNILTDGYTFRPYMSCDVSDYTLVVYNRWGEVVFESTDPELKWEAYSYPPDNYFWTLTVFFPDIATPSTISMNGRVTLIK